MSQNLPKPKRKVKSELEHLSDVIDLMKQSGVHKFKYKEVEVEFDIQLGGNSRSIPDNIDDETERLNAIRKAFKDEINEDDANLLWSTN